MNLQTLLEKLANTSRFPAPEWMDELSAAATALLSETPRGDTAKLERPAAFHTTEPEPCRGCGAPLVVENAWMHDGCPCNTPAGVNDANLYRWKLLSDLQQKQSAELNALRADGGSSKFSDFIRNATDAERAEVYEDVMKKATERQARQSEKLQPSPTWDEVDAIRKGKSDIDLAERIWQLKRELAECRRVSAIYEQSYIALDDHMRNCPQSARAAIIEECAKVCERPFVGTYPTYDQTLAAAAIRALASTAKKERR